MMFDVFDVFGSFSMFGNALCINGVCYKFEKGGIGVCTYELTYDLLLSNAEDGDKEVEIKQKEVKA